MGSLRRARILQADECTIVWQPSARDLAADQPANVSRAAGAATPKSLS